MTKIKILKVNKDGSENLHLGDRILYGCYPVSCSDIEDSKHICDDVSFNVSFVVRGVPVGSDPLDIDWNDISQLGIKK